MKYLVINADDFGWDEDTARCTIDLFERGMITSASIMTDRPATMMALDYAKKNQHRFSFGLHFNLVDGHPAVSRPLPRSLIENNSDLFPSSKIQRLRALTFRFKPAEIIRELNAQLNILKSSGINVVHVDSHGNMHKIPQVILSMRQTLKAQGIKHVRIPQNLFENKNIGKRLWNLGFASGFLGLPRSHYFYMLQSHTNANWFHDLLNVLSNGVTELGIHPGSVELWRQFETAPFLQEEIKTLLSKKGIQLKNFSNIWN